MAVLVGASLGSLIGGLFGGFVAALLAIPIAGALQVLVREAWRATAAPPAPDPDDAAPQGAEPAETVAELQVNLFPVPTDPREHGP
jgi:hypothetical protein